MLARETEARRRTEQEEADRLRIDAERAASPRFGLMLLGGIIVALILTLVVIHILFR
jgi:CHASE3 domain sensor protein